MSNEWGQMLAEHGVISGLAAVDAQDSSATVTGDGPQLVDLTHFAIVEITGEDASAFLQGQFCNDLKAASPMQAQLTGYCTPKGRLLALPILVGSADGYHLLVLQSLKESFIKRLSMFVMRSKVTIKENEDWLCSGVIAGADGSLGNAADWLGALPGGVLDAATSDTRQIIRWHDCPPDNDVAVSRARYIVLSSVAEQLALWNSSTDAEKCDQARWRYADITAGVPSILPAVSESFVPQMLNMQLINALSFTKGCYPGQEIVARMQYLGKLKRHMRSFQLPAGPDTVDVRVLAGDSLSSADDKDAGVVVDAVRNSHGGTVVLAVVKVSANDSTLNVAGVPLQPIELPYPLPSLAEPQADAG